MTRRGRASGGFTLLELVAVLGVLSVLLGLGLGFLNRGATDLDVALSVLRGQCRLAATTAKSEGLPTEVLIRESDGVIRVAARVLRPAGIWHLEEGESWINDVLRPQLTGERVAEGRFGGARRSDPESESALLTVNTRGSDLFDLEDGFAVRVDVLLEGHGAATVARLGRTFELGLDAGTVPFGRVTLSAAGNRSGERVDIKGVDPLPLRRWQTVQLVHDGRRLRLLVDDAEVAARPARGMPFQQKNDLFEVSPGDSPVAGVIDEIQLLAYQRSEPQLLPADVALLGLQGPVRFDRRGMPLESYRLELVMDDNHLRRTIGPGGTLR